VARALYKEASYVFADEPTASLDPDNRRIVTGLLERAAKAGACVVIATHDDALASLTKAFTQLNETITTAEKAVEKNLIDNGRPADTPAAIIRWGTRADQETYVTTVGEAAEMVQREDIRPPAIFIVGEVVKLREQLRWFDRSDIRPLHGKRILVTRARAQASALTEQLTALGASCIETPVIRIAPPADGYAALDHAIDEIHVYQWLIFTSTNGVEHFFARLAHAEKDTRALGYAKVAAIGSATAEALCAHGIHADLVPAEFRDLTVDPVPGHAHLRSLWRAV